MKSTLFALLILAMSCGVKPHWLRSSNSSDDDNSLALTRNTSCASCEKDTVGLYDPQTSHFFLKSSNFDGTATIDFGYGAPGAGWRPISGDWEGSGIATIGLYDPVKSVFYLKRSNGSADDTISFGYGAPSAGWIPIAGDWDGDGVTTVGLYDPARSVFYLKGSNSTADDTTAFAYGAAGAGWLPIAGDWDGDGVTTVGLYDPTTSVFYLKASNGDGNDTTAFGYGAPRAGWLPLAGDWNGDHVSTIGLYDPATSQFYLKKSNGTNNDTMAFGYGSPGKSLKPIAGDWGFRRGYFWGYRNTGVERKIYGWACDVTNMQFQVGVSIYLDTIDAAGFQTNVKADLPTADLEAAKVCGSMAHAFKFAVGGSSLEQKLTDGSEHVLYAVATDIAGHQFVIRSNEKPITRIISSTQKDITICRGKNGEDDRAKESQCDIVCKSTESDCAQILFNALRLATNNTTYVMPGDYPLRNSLKSYHPLTGQLQYQGFFSGKPGFSYEVGLNNEVLVGYGARLRVNFNESEPNQIGFSIGTRQNLSIYGLEVIGNKKCAINGSCFGIRVDNSRNVQLIETRVSLVKGFQYTVERANFLNAAAGDDNVRLRNCYGKGIATNDIIGGGDKVRGVYVMGGLFEQQYLASEPNIYYLYDSTGHVILDRQGKPVVAPYANAIDLVGITGLTVDGATLFGNLLVGAEGILANGEVYGSYAPRSGPKNIAFTNNRIYSAKGLSVNPAIMLARPNVFDVQISGNVLFRPTATMPGLLVFARETICAHAASNGICDAFEFSKCTTGGPLDQCDPSHVASTLEALPNSEAGTQNISVFGNSIN